MSDRELQSILDNSTAVVQVKDLSGRYVRINRRFEEIFGLDRSQILGKTDHDLFPQEVADRFRANDLKVAETGRPLQFEEVAPHQDGPHDYISVKFPLFDEAGTVYATAGIFTDITEYPLLIIAAMAVLAMLRGSGDARGPEYLDPPPGVPGVRVDRADDHPRETGARDGVATRRGAPVRGARLEGDIDRRAAREGRPFQAMRQTAQRRCRETRWRWRRCSRPLSGSMPSRRRRAEPAKDF